MINEICEIVAGRIHNDIFIAEGYYPTEGMPSLVGFNYEDVYDIEDDRFINLIGFYHTHPNFLSYPSSTDDKTMETWVRCLGRPVLCAIEGLDGLKAYWYFEEDDKIWLKELKLIKFKSCYVGEYFV